MRVVYLAAGAAGTICGSCIRDNRLVATLRAAGRDVLLVPLYTPVQTDEDDVSESHVYYGGINVYLQQKYALFRHTPRFFNHWLDSPALLRGVGKMATNTRPEELGALTVAVLRGADGPLLRELDGLIEGLQKLRPRLVNLPNLMFAGIAPELRKRLGVPLVCTLSGEDSFVDRLPEPYRGQAFEAIRRGGDAVHAFVATSRYYAQHCTKHFGLPAERVRHVPLGINHDGPAREREPAHGSFVVAFVARICRDKGLADLADAVIELHRGGRDVRLVAAGFLSSAERKFLDEVERKFGDAGCAGVFEYRGEVSREAKFKLLHDAHVFSMPSAFPEAKGLPVIEALAVGTPVVQPARGSFPEIVHDTGGGLLYDAEEPGALAAAIAKLMDDAELRRRLGAEGCRRVREAWTDQRMADDTWAHYEAVVAEHGASA